MNRKGVYKLYGLNFLHDLLKFPLTLQQNHIKQSTDKKILLSKIDFAISKGTTLIESYTKTPPGISQSKYYSIFRTLGLSTISSALSEKSIYYQEFNLLVDPEGRKPHVHAALGILEMLRHEIEQGWLFTVKELATAEIFGDFLEMSKHLLDTGYKDPAAVMIGSVVEEHLRQLCVKNSIDITILKGTDAVPKKADTMNADLTKASVYGVLEQKNVTAWLDLRNRAAHGKYGEYKIEQVELMYQGVLDFVSRVK